MQKTDIDYKKLAEELKVKKSSEVFQEPEMIKKLMEKNKEALDRLAK